MANVGSVDFSGTIKKLGKINADVLREIGAALFVSGLKIEENAKLSIQREVKTGKAYVRGTVTHIASAAGQAPANDTGRLVNSINTSQSSDKMVVYIKAGEGVVDYAVHLEYGTRNMAPRPFMKPAFNKSEKFIHERMEKAVQKAVKKNAR
jgi:HK97 gp10 family phage protein